MIIELNIKDSKAKSFISFIKELDFVKINTKTKDTILTDADVIFGKGKPATDAQLRKYLTSSNSEKTKELNKMCEEVIAYIGKKGK
ncbi:MAG: hypothetical protein SGJ10_05765 [Bacteroidota bacterium]|nr:hypothetical protein [Bacteroidota bacterium]